MNAIQVLHVDSAIEWRGGQQQLQYLLEARPEDAWAGVPDSPLAGRLGAPQIPLLPGADPRNLLRIRQGAARLGARVIAAHTPHAHGLALAAGRPVIVHRRVDFTPNHPWKYRMADGFVAVSGAVARVLVAAGVRPERVVVVHDGVPLRPPGRPVLDGPSPRFGAIGALVAHKGHRFLVDAMRQLPGTLYIAGEGPLRPALERQIRELGLTGRVHLLGHRDDVADLLASIDLFVHPSVEEGLGQVVIEALGANCRVVATRAGGLPEVIDGVGVLVEPGQSMALIAGVQAALARSGGGEKERAARFSVPTMVKGTAEAYTMLLQRLGRRSTL